MSRRQAPEYGSDLIVDLLSDSGIEYVAFNPGATFRGIHDSLVHAQRSAGAPGIVTCLHEAVSVAAAQGYAKATGRPMAVLLHDVVGLQNASMAVYNAWCDRVPMLLLGGTGPLSKARRRPWIDWIHTASVQAEVIRNFVKWDDQPHDVASIPESFARALHTTLSEPAGPVYLCYDVGLQEDPLPDGFTAESVRGYVTPTPPAAQAQDLQWLAGRLMQAAFPVLVAGYSGEADAGFADLVALAEVLGTPVVDTASRCNFPSSHPLNASGVPELADSADLLVFLDVDDPRGLLRHRVGGARAGAAEVVNVTLAHLRARGWSHDYQALAPAARHITAAAGPVVGALLDRIQHTATGLDRQRWSARGARIADATGAERTRRRAAASRSSAAGSVPVDRLIWEVGQAVATTPYVLANGTNERYEHRLWDLTRPRQHCGWHAGGGLGYGLGAAVGVALGTGPDVTTVNIQADGDALFTPGALWTMAQQRLPILTVVHNNREYGNSIEHAHQIAVARGRPVDRIGVGTSLADPAIDLATLARAFGVWAQGPVRTPDQLAEALAQAMLVVRSGHPALIDVITPSFAEGSHLSTATRAAPKEPRWPHLQPSPPTLSPGTYTAGTSAC